MLRNNFIFISCLIGVKLFLSSKKSQATYYSITCLGWTWSFFIILMPPSGNKNQLQFRIQFKVRRGRFDNNSLHKKFTQCQLNVLFVALYDFVSYPFPLYAGSSHKCHISCLASYVLFVHVRACAYLGQSFLSVLTAGLCSRTVSVMAWYRCSRASVNNDSPPFPPQLNCRHQSCQIPRPSTCRRALSSSLWLLVMFVLRQPGDEKDWAKLSVEKI